MIILRRRYAAGQTYAHRCMRALLCLVPLLDCELDLDLDLDLDLKVKHELELENELDLELDRS